MAAKRGRPTSDPKKHETRIRMSDQDIHMLRTCCERTGMNQSEIIREGIRLIHTALIIQEK